jgi:hypothetical protein
VIAEIESGVAARECMTPIAFLFRTDKLQTSDLDRWCRIIFRHVLAATPEANFHLRAGGVLLWRFTYRTSAVERKTRGKYPSVSHTLSDDAELRATLAVAFAKSAAAQPHHIDTDELSTVLLREKIDCITVSEMSAECGELVHAEFQKESSAYLGCFEVDRGDPLVLELAANGLIPFCSYTGGTLKWLIPWGDRPEDQAPLSWPTGLRFGKVEFSTETPAPIQSAPSSTVGTENARLLSSRAQPKHAQNVLTALRDSLEASKDSTEVAVSFGESEFGRGRSDVRKLRDYSLNEQHPQGKHKALLFRKLLGITAEDWLFLAEQLIAGLEKELVKRPVKSPWGVQYHINVPVVGRNGQTKLVTSAWIIRSNEPPSLVSAYVADKADTDDSAALAHLVVEKEVEGAERWRRIYDLADAQGRKAAEAWTPTPMWITGYAEAIAEGACGSAWVRLPDGRSSFSRWLKKNKLSFEHSRHCIIFGKTTSQSVEREQKYCEAFAQVLRLNGIQCEVKWRYD